MIRSKIERLQEARMNARLSLELGLATKRGSKIARAESKALLEAALKTNTCQACNGPLLLPARVTTGYYCRSCQARFDRMLNFKSKLSRGIPMNRALERFIADYSATEHLPYPLRGVASRQNIIRHATELLELNKEIDKQLRDAIAWRNSHAGLQEEEVSEDANRNEEETM